MLLSSWLSLPLNDASEDVTSAAASAKRLPRYSTFASFFTSCVERPPRFLSVLGVEGGTSTRAVLSGATSFLGGVVRLSGRLSVCLRGRLSILFLSGWTGSGWTD